MAVGFLSPSPIPQGLEKVSTTTLTASSGQVITGLSAGSRYRILLSIYGSVDSEQLLIQFREGSTNKNTSYYGGTYQVSPTSAGVFDYINNEARGELGRISNSADILSSHSYDLYINSNANQATLIGEAAVWNGAMFMLHVGVNNSSMATCDGFYIYPASGTITGTLTLYKYQD